MRRRAALASFVALASFLALVAGVAFALVAGVAFTGGCQNNFDPASYVSGLRVLAVKAEPPEIAAGETSSLTVLATDTNGARVSYAWGYCTKAPGPGDPAVSLDCVRDNGPPTIAPIAATGAMATVTMPMLDPRKLGLPDYTLGFYQPIRVRASASAPGGDGGIDDLLTFYRLRLATGLEPRNHNPVLTGMFAVAGPMLPDAGLDSQVPLDDAHPPVLHRGDTITLRALVDVRSIENFVVLDGDPAKMQLKTVEEQPRFLWYATAGSFSDDVTGLNHADTNFKLDVRLPTLVVPDAGTTDAGAPTDPEARVTIWVVVHDERGGVDYTSRTLLVR